MPDVRAGKSVFLLSNMSVLAPTPSHRLVDARGRAYFLRDEDMTLDDFRARLRDPSGVQAELIAKITANG
jgi:hypothetical protein